MDEFDLIGRAESGQLFRRERVMKAVSAFGDVENPWNVHFGKPPCGHEYELIRSLDGDRICAA